jgi:hypothetical protein
MVTGTGTIVRMGIVVCAALATIKQPASAAAPAATSPAAGRTAAPPAEYQQAEAVLTGRGLTLVSFTYLVANDAKLRDGLGKMRQAKAKLDAYVAKRKQLERDIGDAEAALSAANAAVIAAGNRLAAANRAAADYNSYVRASNAAGVRSDEVKRARDARVKALAELPQPTGDYAGALIELTDSMDVAAKQYEALAADPAVAAALAQLNRTARPQLKLGPSAQFAQELRGVRFQRDQLAAQAIPVKVGRNNLAIVPVKLNDADPVDMIFDSGASLISLSAEVAKRAGIVPGPNDPTIKAQIANGAIVECRLVRARSVRVGTSILHDVECTVSPASEPNTPLLLGGSFHKNFIVRLDLGAGQLHLTPIIKMAPVKKDSLAAAEPAKPVGLAGGRTEVTVPSDRNGDKPLPTGVRLLKGQTVTFAPYTADRWRAGPPSEHKLLDYRGHPDDPGSMRLRWKIGGATGDVTPGKAVVAGEAAELHLFCNDTFTGDNTGSIRVTVIPGPVPTPAVAPPAGPATRSSDDPPAGPGDGVVRSSTRPAGVTAEAIAARVARLKAVGAKPPADAGPPAPMPLGDPLKDDVVWAATPAGFALSGRVQVGNFDKKKFGGDYKGNVRAESGFRLDGGDIVVTVGTLELIGTPDRPVVLRNVKIGCEMYGSVKARHAVFENCTFYKAPGGYWTNGYTSKWTLDDCLLRDSNFDKLYRIDYGIKFRRTSFVDCAIPPRRIVDFNDKTVEVDAAKDARHEWSEIADCDFHRCRVAASTTWYMRSCNLFGCLVTDPFESNTKTDVAVEVGVGPADAGTVDEMRAKTTTTAAGKVTYAAAATPFANRAFPAD